MKKNLSSSLCIHSHIYFVEIDGRLVSLKISTSKARIYGKKKKKKGKKSLDGSSIVYYADYTRMEFTNAHRLRIGLSIRERNLSVSARMSRDFNLMNRTLSLPLSLSSPVQFRFVPTSR